MGFRLGLSYHMISHREWFLNYKDIGGGNVILGDNHECNIKGTGDIKLRMDW